MASLAGFDASQVPPETGFDTMPAGDYDVVITESKLAPNKSGVGQHLKLTLQVINGQYQNRKLWARLNIDHPNATAQKIGRGELSAICRAVGVLQPKDSSELHNKPLKVKVVVDDDGRGNLSNEIKAFKPRHQGGPTTTAQPSQPQLGPSQIAQPLVTEPSVPQGPRNPFA